MALSKANQGDTGRRREKENHARNRTAIQLPEGRANRDTLDLHLDAYLASRQRLPRKPIRPRQKICDSAETREQ